MTRKPQSSQQNDVGIDPRLRDRCQAYLLGEMDSGEAAEFEGMLDQPLVAEAVLMESELLLQVSNATEPSPVELPPIDLPPRRSLRSVAIAISGLAAAFLIAVLIQQTRDASQVTDSEPVDPLQLAIALAEPAVQWDTPTWEMSVTDAIDDDDPLDQTNEEDLDWMLVALESVELGNENDG